MSGDSAKRGPRLEIAIHILEDGRVVFGDLPPDLAQVAEILRGNEADGAPQAADSVVPSPNPADMR